MFPFKELQKAEDTKASIVVPEEETAADYYDLRKQLDELAKDMRDVIMHPAYSVPFFQPGRLVKIKHNDLDFGWAVVVNCQKKVTPKDRVRRL